MTAKETQARQFAEQHATDNAEAPHRMAGTCHKVAGEIERRFGVRKAVGFVMALYPSGETLRRAHAWNVCADGTIIDATVGQFLDAWDYSEERLPDSKCADCGEDYFLSEEWDDSMFCSPACRVAFAASM
jgi:hypothetical protein